MVAEILLVYLRSEDEYEASKGGSAVFGWDLGRGCDGVTGCMGERADRRAGGVRAAQSGTARRRRRRRLGSLGVTQGVARSE